MIKLILASASPRRKQLLEQIGLQFEISSSDIEEILTPGLTPREQVETLSKQKAEAVSLRFQNKEVLILSADSMVAIDGEVLGKPKDKDDAVSMLKRLSGRTHSIVTGFTLFQTRTKKTVTKSIETTVWFREISEKEIENYLSKDKPFDKAGAYAIQELAAVFIEKIEGDYFGAVGLPLFVLAKELKQFGVEIL